jgi:hypothetical protein
VITVEKKKNSTSKHMHHRFQFNNFTVGTKTKGNWNVFGTGHSIKIYFTTCKVISTQYFGFSFQTTTTVIMTGGPVVTNQPPPGTFVVTTTNPQPPAYGQPMVQPGVAQPVGQLGYDQPAYGQPNLNQPDADVVKTY